MNFAYKYENLHDLLCDIPFLTIANDKKRFILQTEKVDKNLKKHAKKKHLGKNFYHNIVII